MNKGLSVVVALALPILVYAQRTSRLGRFSVDAVRGCAPLTVHLTSHDTADCTPASPCAMDYEGNGTDRQNLFTYTYTSPGVYTLSVLYQAVGADDIRITVAPDRAPPIALSACGGQRVTLNIADTVYNLYHINMDDGNGEITLTRGADPYATAYLSAGRKNITVRGQYAGAKDNCRDTARAFTPLQTLPAPTLNALSEGQGTQAQVAYSGRPDIAYRLEMATDAGPFQPAPTATHSGGVFVVPSLDVDARRYGFRVSAYDPCRNSDIYSEEVYTTGFKLTAENGYNALTWNAPAGLTHTEVSRDGQPLARVNAPTAHVDDSTVICSTSYCYTLLAAYSSGAVVSSVEKCAAATLSRTLEPLRDITARTQENNVRLTWPEEPSASYVYTVERRLGKRPFTVRGTTPTPPFSDTCCMDEEERPCYRISYVDPCGNYAPAHTQVCPLRLAGSVESDNTVTLTWNAYSGWEQGVKSYTLYKYDEGGNLLASFDNGTDTAFVDIKNDPPHQIVTYRVEAQRDAAPAEPSTSNALTLTRYLRPFFPTAFTPDGDGLNDGFRVSGEYLARAQLSIFNPWGELIYYSSDNVPWNGTHGGKPVPEGAYVWSARLTDFRGDSSQAWGTVMVLRKKK